MGNLPYNLITFPVWWYTEGLVMAWRWMQTKCRFVIKSSGISIFIRHLKDPLYGDYTRSGIIISFFLRLIILVFLVAWVAARLALTFLAFVFHLVILPLSLVMILYSIVPK